MPGGNAAAAGVRSQSYIDASLTIVGDLHTQGDVQLDGRVCGNISCAQLIVGRDAAVTGTIAAQEVIVRGTVTGTIRGPVVILQEPARVESDIVYTVLAIDDGVNFEGGARRSERPLEETEPQTQLAELQRIVRAADPRANGHAAAGGTEGAAAQDRPSAA